MLGKFRENARSWVVHVVIGAIAVVFVISFGPGSRGMRTAITSGTEWAAKVNGQLVPVNTFQELYSNQVYRMQQYGMGTPEQLKQMKVREDVMKEVVDEELLAQAAEKSGLYVSDEDLAKAVRRSGRFTDPDSGKFDRERYAEYTHHYESAKSFEGRIRRMLMAARESEILATAVPVSDDELKAAFLKQEEGASIAYVKFQPGNYRDQVKVEQADIDAELKDHAADVQKKFDDTKMLYTDPRALKAHRLFAAVKQDATPAEDADAKKKIDDAKAALDSGKKWEELQPQFAADPKKDGDLGFVQLGRSGLGTKTEEAIFKLKPGERSDVVHDRFGYSIVQVTEERAPTEKKFDDVKKDIATDMVKEAKAKELAKAAAQKTLDQLKAGQGLEAQWPKQEKPAKDAPPVSPEEQKKPHSVVTEEFHPNGGVIPSAGSLPKVSAAVFALTSEKRFPDAVLEDQNAYWVVELKSRTRADMAKLATDRDTLMDKVENERRGDARKLLVDHLRKDAKIEENPDYLSYDRKARGNNPEQDDG